MSLKVGHILVQSESFERVAELVRSHLDGWYRNTYLSADVGQRLRSPEIFFLDDEGIRSLVALPPVKGWTIILERVLGRADLDLAKTLSAELPARVVVTEVDGTRYRWANLVYEAGGLADWTLEPKDAFEAYYRRRAPADASWGDRAEMPLYKDVETAALAYLGSQGIPSEITFLCHDDVSAGLDGSAEQAMFFKIWERSDGPAFRHYVFSAKFEPAVEDHVAPLRYDHVELKADISQQHVKEHRYVYGEPSEAALGNLIDLEDRFRQRVFDCGVQECIDELLPDVDFEYLHESGDERLQRLLRSTKAARRASKRALYHKAVFSRFGFCNRAGEIVRDAFVEYTFLETDAFEVHFRRAPGGGTEVWPLGAAYEAYLQRPDRLTELVVEGFRAFIKAGSGA